MWKHPHARGEDGHRNQAPSVRQETPPRTWGRLQRIQRMESRGGNTPTHVGKTAPQSHPFFQREKHPHARGEDRSETTPAMHPQETPPRTWGRRRELQDLRWKDGNTPTHVGKTTPTHVGKTGAAPGRHLPFWKHPHARGEDRHTVEILPGHGETPPRTWGRRKGSPQSGLAGRNTPTHVGKTPSVENNVCLSRKHPHARGEDSP